MLSKFILEIVKKKNTYRKTPVCMMIFYSVQRVRKSISLFCNIDSFVPLSLEFIKRHFTRSKILPYLAEIHSTLKSCLLFFFCFVHLNHITSFFSMQMYKVYSKLPNKNLKNLSKSAFYYIVFYYLTIIPLVLSSIL